MLETSATDKAITNHERNELVLVDGVDRFVRENPTFLRRSEALYIYGQLVMNTPEGDKQAHVKQGPLDEERFSLCSSFLIDLSFTFLFLFISHLKQDDSNGPNNI